MKKVFRKIHLWLSFPFGLLITLICFSGAMLVFETEVMELCHRDLYYVEKVGPAPLPMGKVAEKVAATLPDSVSVTGVTASSAPERAWQVNLSKPRRASVYVDQYTGEIKGKYERAPFFTTMFRLHRWLLDSMKPDGGIFWGKMIVGTATLMFVFVLISGIVICWPRTKKALKNQRVHTACHMQVIAEPTPTLTGNNLQTVLQSFRSGNHARGWRTWCFGTNCCPGRRTGSRPVWWQTGR